MRRRQNGQLDYDALIFGVFYAAGAVGLTFFVQCTLVSLYWLIFYKAQDAVFIMIPENTQVVYIGRRTTIVCCPQNLIHEWFCCVSDMHGSTIVYE